MPFHIGNILQKLADDAKLKAKDVGKAIGASEQTVGRAYTDQSIHSDRLIKFSLLLKRNLFSLFREHEELKDLPDPIFDALTQEIEQHKKTIARQNKALEEKDKSILNLETIIRQQQKIDELKHRDPNEN